jgi:hypothetical protein
VSCCHLRRWLVAIVMIVGIAAVGAGQSEPSASASADRNPLPGGAASARGWSATEGIVPVQARVETVSGYERGVRLKVPVLAGAVGAALLASVVASRSGFRRHHSSRLPLALGARSVPRRAPPLLPLG